MPIVAVNVIKVLFVVALYLFLFYVARSMRGHVAGPPLNTSASPSPQSVRRPPAAAPPSRSRSILIFDDDGQSTSHSITGTVVVGRGESADIRLDDEFASERHASFAVEGSAVVVEDLGSTNGTTIDGHPVTGRTEVTSGTVVIVGRTRVVVT
jgi:pSer/pThr/pTyr-binding forkhead associated (FHA) protein